MTTIAADQAEVERRVRAMLERRAQEQEQEPARPEWPRLPDRRSHRSCRLGRHLINEVMT